MIVLLAALVIVAMPFLAVTLLLKLSERLQDRRDLERDRQIELTDAIHWELGAVAAPLVRRIRRGWRVSMALPLDRSVEVATIVRLTAKQFGQPGWSFVQHVASETQADPHAFELGRFPQLPFWHSRQVPEHPGPGRPSGLS